MPPRASLKASVTWRQPNRGAERVISVRRAPVPEPGTGGKRAHWSRRRPVWLGPVSATAAVALVAGVTVALVLHAVSGNRSVPAASGPASTASGPPRYYLDLEPYGLTFVRATATGAVTSRPLIPCGTTAAASADDRTFYVGCYGDFHGSLYRFRITGAGKAYGLTQVPGGRALSGLYVQVMALSPDGSQIALAGFYPDSQPEPPPPVILVINLRTGAQTVWRGGLAGPGSQLGISSLSWTDGGRSLVFLATWCAPSAKAADSCPGVSSFVRGNHEAEVWALDPAAGGGWLDSGRLVLRQSARFPDIVQALISGDGRTIIAAVLSGQQNEYTLLPDDLSIVRIFVATGRPADVLYRGLVKSGVSLSADGSGKYLLLIDGDDARHHGWIDQGHIHGLPAYDGDGLMMAW